MGQTRVDLLHLLEDLRDAYPGALEETILGEVVANALDSGAARISVRADPGEALLLVVDDGRGMRRRELARYHDIAASTKVRGLGIGFAGVGIKLGLLASEEVLTETRRDDGHVATRWRLQGRHEAPWRWVDPPGLVEAGGGAAARGRARARHQHAGQGHPARVGLARPRARGPAARRRAGGSAGAGGVADPEQGRLHRPGRPRDDVSRVSQGDPGGRGRAARGLGRGEGPRGFRAAPRRAPARARPGDGARGSGGGVPGGDGAQTGSMVALEPS